jgi:hypothetical protein
MFFSDNNASGSTMDGLIPSIIVSTQMSFGMYCY